ncbi:MAG: GNAT family N-acetyltransferase [Anaerolineae bacterium]|nr:GNAT family N-acetyltransferase [Anaerolineae bacterium]
MQIINLSPTDEPTIQQVAALLVDGFREHYPDAWPDLDSALAEVRESFAPDRVSRVALDDDGTVLGWIGGISQYDGNVWELHPLVVKPDRQRQGIGRALVADLEAQVRARGALTLWLGTDDEDNQTTLAGADLYPDVLEQARNIRNLRDHPYTFYQKVGFVIVGVMPDANGFGQPDIFMAKRVKSE